jgi:hypothetical protein
MFCLILTQPCLETFSLTCENLKLGLCCISCALKVSQAVLHQSWVINFTCMISDNVEKSCQWRRQSISPNCVFFNSTLPQPVGKRI